MTTNNQWYYIEQKDGGSIKRVFFSKGEADQYIIDHNLNDSWVIVDYNTYFKGAV